MSNDPKVPQVLALGPVVAISYEVNTLAGRRVHTKTFEPGEASLLEGKRGGRVLIGKPRP